MTKKNTKPQSKPAKSAPARTPITKLPQHLEDFAHLMHGGKYSQRDAAVKIGKSAGSGKYLFHRPDVQQRIAEIKEEYGKRMLESRVEKTIREITIDRNDIIMGLADIAKEGESERAKVAAWLGLADIFMLRAKNVREVKDFYGWKADELREFAINGTIPERFRLLVGEGEGAGLGGSPSLRTDKK